jgi:ribosome-associated protein
MASIANNAVDRSRLFDLAALIDDHQGEHTVILEVTEECSFADYFIITTARSSRHAASLVGYVREWLEARGMPVFNKAQADAQSGWALLDCGTIIVHVMESAARSFYELEKLWFRAKTLAYSSKSS